MRPGFPIAELRPDGSCLITGHRGTVTVDTVTAQLLYETDRPAYLSPDVTACFDTVTLQQLGPDRSRSAGARGGGSPGHRPAACLNHRGGYRDSAVFVLTGLDIEAKAAFAGATHLRTPPGTRQIRRPG